MASSRAGGSSVGLASASLLQPFFHCCPGFVQLHRQPGIRKSCEECCRQPSSNVLFFFAHFHIKRSEIPGITSQAPHYMSTICAKIISSVTKGSWSNKLLLRKMTQQFWEGGGRTNNQSKETFDPIQKRSSWFTVLHCATC